MRIVYPLLWARLGREASQEQAIATAAAMARQGHEVTLLLPQGRGDPNLTATDIRQWFEVAGDFGTVQQPSAWSGVRLDRTLLWLRQVFRHPAVTLADVLYSRIPAMIAMGRLSPIAFATDHYRPWPDELPLIRPAVRWTARAPHCLGLVLHSHYAAAAYRRAGVPEQRLLVAHNGFDPPGKRFDKQAARQRLGLPAERDIAVYAGRINAAKGLHTLLAIADRRPEVLFALVGSEGEGEIERAAARRPNVRVVPWAEPHALQPWLFAADVLIIPPSLVPLHQARTCVLPIKVFAYLAAGRPILAPAAPDTAELLEHGRTAWLVRPDDTDEAAEGLDRLLGDIVLSGELATNAQRLSESLTWDRRATAISAFLEARMAQRSAHNSTLMPISKPSTGVAQAPNAGGT